jgi:hypothetical protein
VDHAVAGYEPYRSESGVAIALRHWEEEGKRRWQLDYEKDGKLRRIYGCGEQEAVDLGIRVEDYVGSFVCHRSGFGGRYLPGTPVWMRSQDLNIRPENVVTTYRQSAQAATDGATG